MGRRGDDKPCGFPGVRNRRRHPSQWRDQILGRLQRIRCQWHRASVVGADAGNYLQYRSHARSGRRSCCHRLSVRQERIRYLRNSSPMAAANISILPRSTATTTRLARELSTCCPEIFRRCSPQYGLSNVPIWDTEWGIGGADRHHRHSQQEAFVSTGLILQAAARGPDGDFLCLRQCQHCSL